MQECRCECVAGADGIDDIHGVTRKKAQFVLMKDSAAAMTQRDGNRFYVKQCRPETAESLQCKGLIGGHRRVENLSLRFIQLDDGREVRKPQHQGQIPMPLAQIQIVETFGLREQACEGMHDSLV